MLREHWTLSDIQVLPTGEHDFFDRKSGKLLNDINNFQATLAKAISAFANSGGGHIILGVADNGDIDGVPKFFKERTNTREWIEQIIPNLVEPESLKFRVHLIEYDNSTDIIVIVIDIGDSFFAPYQVRKSKVYYYRAAGHSKPAAHFYLEAVRNRQRLPALTATLTKARLIRTMRTEQTIFLQIVAFFDITNIGVITPTHWILDLANNGERLTGEGFVVRRNFPTPTIEWTSNIHTKAVLPSQTVQCKEMIGFHIPALSFGCNGLQEKIDVFFNQNIKLTASVITNTNICEESELKPYHLRNSLVTAEIIDSVSEIKDNYTGEIGLGLQIYNFSIDIHNSSVNNPVKPGDHSHYHGDIENLTDVNFKELFIVIIFRDKNGILLSTTKEKIGLLAPRSRRPFNGWVEANEIWNAEKKEFFAYENFIY